jgi:hypothetical protein
MFNGGVFNSFIYNGTIGGGGGTTLDVPMGIIERAIGYPEIVVPLVIGTIVTEVPAGDAFAHKPAQNIEQDTPKHGII